MRNRLAAVALMTPSIPAFADPLSADMPKETVDALLGATTQSCVKGVGNNNPGLNASQTQTFCACTARLIAAKATKDDVVFALQHNGGLPPAFETYSKKVVLPQCIAEATVSG